TNPDNIIGTSIQYNSGSSNGAAYVTTDGGKTWKTIPAPNPRQLQQGDDSLTFSGEGVAYHLYMSFTGIRQPRPRRAQSGFFVISSKDKGATWSDPVPVIDHTSSVTPFEDKPYVVTDNVPGSPYRNNV